MPKMPLLTGYYNIGKIVWKYATGYDFETQKEPVEVPSDAELQVEFETAGLNLPEGVKIKVVRDDPTTFHVVLRDPETMRSSLADLRSDDGLYDFSAELRSEYADFLADSSQYKGSSAAAKENRVRLVSHRLADYTFTLCAS